MKLFYFLFTPVYLFLEIYGFQVLMGYGGLAYKVFGFLHLFPFDFGYSSGAMAWLSLLLNYSLWWTLAYLIYRRRIKTKTNGRKDLIDDI